MSATEPDETPTTTESAPRAHPQHPAAPDGEQIVVLDDETAVSEDLPSRTANAAPCSPTAESSATDTSDTDSPAADTAASNSADDEAHRRHGPLLGLTLGAIGIVFGDIGTSPLYALQTTFAVSHHRLDTTVTDIYGVMSLVFWTVLAVVTVKYVFFILRADNDGEGGLLAMVALLRRHLPATGKLAAVVLGLGLLGAALFYGDSVITPAISVLSAVEGLEHTYPGFKKWTMPTALVILTGLFMVQRFGTAKVGRAFGPVMVLWFVVLAALGLPFIVQRPEVLLALSPHHAFTFVASDPFDAFMALSGVVLTITGAEALYADMGHFGARPIRLAWFWLVFPALMINYLGQTAHILNDPSAVSSPFFSMAPGWAAVPLVVLATMATVIASQAVISGAFSVSRQAVRLGLLPRLTVKQTSRHEGGQIFVPAVNGVLFVGVLTLLLAFESSEKLASAYGLAVTGTLVITTAMFLILARKAWRWPWWALVMFAIVIGAGEVIYFAANSAKVAHGGWLPLVIAALVIVVMTTWRWGREVITGARQSREGSLADFVDEVHARQVPRIPGLAVYPHPDLSTAPLAMRSNLDFNHVLHERNIILQIINENVPHIRHVDRVSVDDLGHGDDGIIAVTVRIGFNDSQDIPKAIALAAPKITEFDCDETEAFYFLSVINVEQADEGWRQWRKALFVSLASNSSNRTRVFHLPPERTVTMGARIAI